ncbi:hypothetical protein BDV96DRAFT_613917 [Lophiotrema nucula]|uniref:Uncharacterized protein n=1 Tax=Lophiotrema nucula TaxID=690887 RepID=A0A6A5Z0I1_9PLEO|nr:hypothetical protein BDV96DRAFT_613917 [Lophiotrema nucula]
MYVIWWHKPRQVEAPTLLHGEWVLPIAAYMYSASRMSGQRPQGTFGRLVNPTPELKQMAYVEEAAADTATDTIAPLYRTTTLSSTTTRRTSRGSLRPVVTGQSMPEATPPEEGPHLQRRRLVELAIEQYPAIRARFKTDTSQLSAHDYQQSLIPYATELVQPHSLNWPNAGLLRRTQSLILGMVLWGASMVYGAIHVSAWDYFFPTAVEHLLWRLSSVWVTFCAAFWFLTNLLAHFLSFIDRVWIAFNERRLGWFGSTIIIVLCTLCGVSFISRYTNFG